MTRRDWNRDTSAVTIPDFKGGHGDVRPGQLTLALGRVVGA